MLFGYSKKGHISREEISWWNEGKYEAENEKDGDDKDNEVWTPFPEKEDDQKIFWKLTRGIARELQSSDMVRTQINVLTGEKDFYKKGEEITASLSKDDEKIIKNKNSCSYQLFGRYFNNIKKYPSGYPNINVQIYVITLRNFLI